MKPSAAPSLDAAAVALGEAGDDLAALPACAETRELERRWFALRTVIHNVVIEKIPSVSPEQEAKLLASALCFAQEVAEARRRRA